MVATLRAKLAYYEHFDDLIRENISRSADLFKAAFAARNGVSLVSGAAAEEEIAAEVDRRLYAERVHAQHVLMSLMDEATYVQQRADTLIQRLAEAITELANLIPEEDEPVSGA